jgi:hypothetical protein
VDSWSRRLPLVEHWPHSFVDSYHRLRSADVAHQEEIAVEMLRAARQALEVAHQMEELQAPHFADLDLAVDQPEERWLLGDLG